MQQVVSQAAASVLEEQPVEAAGQVPATPTPLPLPKSLQERATSPEGFEDSKSRTYGNEGLVYFVGVILSSSTCWSRITVAELDNLAHSRGWLVRSSTGPFTVPLLRQHGQLLGSP